MPYIWRANLWILFARESMWVGLRLEMEFHKIL